MFNVQNAEAMCDRSPNRAEKHGAESVTAVDLYITVKVPSAQMEQFHEKLQTAMFRQPLGGEQQELIGDGFTELQFPRIQIWPWGDQYEGCELTVASALGLADPVHMVDVKVDKFELRPEPGGTVAVSFRAQVHPEDEVECGRLCFLANKAIKVTLTPPAIVPQQLDLSDAANSDDDQLQQAEDAMGAAA